MKGTLFKYSKLISVLTWTKKCNWFPVRNTSLVDSTTDEDTFWPPPPRNAWIDRHLLLWSVMHGSRYVLIPIPIPIPIPAFCKFWFRFWFRFQKKFSDSTPIPIPAQFDFDDSDSDSSRNVTDFGIDSVYGSDSVIGIMHHWLWSTPYSVDLIVVRT